MSRYLLSFALVFAGFTGAATAQEELALPKASTVSVAQDGAWLEKLSAPQYTRLNARGELAGDLGWLANDGVRMLPNMPVTLVSRGRIVARVLTNADGAFRFSQVNPGIYTIVASDPRELLILPIMVAPADGSEVKPIHLIAAAPIAPDRRSAMLASVAMLPMPVGPMAPAPMVQGAVAPSSATGNWNPNWPESRTIASTYEVAIGANNEVEGQISVMGYPVGAIDLTGMMVRMMREGELVGEAPVAANGYFRVEQVSPGPVSVVVFGPQGFAALGVKLVSQNGFTKKANANQETFVSLLQGADTNLRIEIAPPEDVIAGSSIPGDSLSVPPPFANAPGFGPGGFGAGGFGPGGGGGGFGGGGGGGFGGGMGGIGALGALGAAAALAGGNDNGFVPTAQSIP